MSFLKEKLPNVKLLIIGNGITVPKLKKMSDELSLNNFIEFIEWPGHDKLTSYFRVAKVFISPQPECEFWNTTIPHKLFEYMSKSKPVLASDSKAIKPIVDESKCGLTYRSGNAESFAEKAVEISSSDIPFGENGLEAVKENYNWGIDSKELIRLYSDIFCR